jgi:hypothetical protein
MDGGSFWWWHIEKMHGGSSWNLKIPPAVRWAQRMIREDWVYKYAHLSFRWDAERGPDIVLHDWHDGEHPLPCAWVTPQGRWIGVHFGGHCEALEEYVNRCCTSSNVEKRGWIHAGGQSDTDCPRYDGKPITPAQRRKLEKHGYNPRD